MTPRFDPEAAARFLDLLAEGEERGVTFQTFGGKPPPRVIQWHPSVISELEELNQAGAGIFLCVNRTDSKGREAANIVRVRAAFCDLDGAPLEPVQSAGCSPHIIVASSPGRFHAYWLLSDCPLDQFKPLQQALARRFHSDPCVHDLPRVMRLPGSVNYKHDEPFLVRVTYCNGHQPVSTAQLVQGIGLDLSAASSPNGSEERVSDAAYERAILSGDPASVHDALLRLAARLARRGMPAEQIELRLYALLDRAAWRETDPQRWKERRAEVERLVRGGAKYRPASAGKGPAPLSNTLANAIDACEDVLPRIDRETWRSAFYGARFGQHAGRVFPWQDVHDLEVAAWVQRVPRYARISVGHVRDALECIAARNERDEMVEWLESLEWDGKLRLGELGVTGFGVAEDALFERAVIANHLIAAVARQYLPGAKHDHVLVLEGEQGTLKSSAIAALYGQQYVAEVHADPTSRDGMLLTRGKIALDLAELSAMRRSDVERFKAWVTLRVDEYRPPYGRLPVRMPRRFVVTATTNESQYLLDATGNRRFLPVRCGRIDLAYLRDNRDQLFAEARQRVRDNYPYHDFPLAEAQEAQDARVVNDPWEEPLSKYLESRPETVTTGKCFEVLNIDAVHRTKAGEQRIVACLRRLGWESAGRRREGGARMRLWTRKAGP